MTTNIFEQAARLKLRFQPPAGGNLSVEDLWDLPLTSSRGNNLNDIAIALHSQLKQDTVSFVEDVKKPDAVVQLSFDLVKHVIDVKKAENAAAREAREKNEKKQRLLAALAQREDQDLQGKTTDELREMINNL